MHAQQHIHACTKMHAMHCYQGNTVICTGPVAPDERVQVWATMHCVSLRDAMLHALQATQRHCTWQDTACRGSGNTQSSAEVGISPVVARLLQALLLALHARKPLLFSASFLF